MSARKGAGVNRLLTKLRQSIENKNFYEAHQLYRTLYFRYTSQEKYAELINLLYDGATLLLQNEQHESGADLSMLLLDVLKKAATPVSDELLDKIGTLFQLLAPLGSVERPSFVVSAQKWIQQGDAEDSQKLHKVIAVILWKEKNYPMSRYHFVRSSDGEGCANMLIEFSLARGFPSEVDLFIAQTVFQYLCLRNKPTADRAFEIYTLNHPHIEKGPPFRYSPLLNFLWFLLLAAESGKLAVFTVLCEQYQQSINRDPCYREYLDRIGQIFFGLPPPTKAGPGGMLGNLINSLMGDLGDDSDDETPHHSTFSANHSQPLISEDLD